MEEDSEGNYHIRHIIPPDEYTFYVGDNIFTNKMAKFSLLCANQYTSLITFTSNTISYLIITLNTKNIKQADIILIF